MKLITLTVFIHRDIESIRIIFSPNRVLNNLVKKIPGVEWSQTHKCWYIPFSRENYDAIATTVGTHANINNNKLKKYLHRKNKITAVPSAQEPIANNRPPSLKLQNISDHNLDELAKFLEQLKLKDYSTSTIKTYRNEFCQLLQTIAQKPVETVTAEDLKRYMVYCYEKLLLTENALLSRMNALKFYFEQVLKHEKFFWKISRPKKPLQLPKVISEEKIIEGILSVENLKHRTLLLLAYSAGLSVSEVVQLKITDINSDRMQIFINNAKGKKDRVEPLSQRILPVLREYYKLYKPKEWLFEGQFANEQYSTRSAQKIFKEAYSKLKMPPGISFHSLRYSFATHLPENGTDIAYIQKLLGHNDIQTTLRYTTHVSNKDISKIESPLDKIMRKKGYKNLHIFNCRLPII